MAVALGSLENCCTFITVFHRILDFKNGAGFLSWPLYFFIADYADLGRISQIRERRKRTYERSDAIVR